MNSSRTPSDPALWDGDKKAYAELLQELVSLQQELITLEHESAETLGKVDMRHLGSAANLIHYLGLRRRDIRPLQEKLAVIGLSSLGRAESRVLTNLHAIIVLLQRALGKPVEPMPSTAVDPSVTGSALLEVNTSHLLGKLQSHRHGRIMVTLPADSADDYPLIKEMLLRGMDCARINCAHDGPDVWMRMIAQIRRARRETGRRCRILMDLAGPKLRTGEIALAPPVLRWQPQRDVYGNVIAPARIWIYPESDASLPPSSTHARLPVKDDWLAQLTEKDRIELTDTRGATRRLQLVARAGAGYWAESAQTTYVRPGVKLFLIRDPGNGRGRGTGYAGEVGALPQIPEKIRLYRGDTLILTRNPVPGRPARYDKRGRLLHPATIACSLPGIFSDLHPGERLLIDDGRIGGLIRSVREDELLVEITQARDSGEKLLADKGINLPDSQLALQGLTDQDIGNLEFVARHADMVGLSFVRHPADIELLQQHLKRLDAEKLGIVIKIETRTAFEQLPSLLLTLLQSPVVGVMIARGDLAVECGYERLAELQEEILWLAEAARLPVIWATQVLEGLVKTGKPTRAEVTDAAMGERAECVMLNKGPHIIQGIQMLDDVLQRMQAHQHKKSARLRQLHW